MPNTIPSQSVAMDSYFLSTWAEIQADAVDNILLATPIWAALKMGGSFTTQRGGYFVDRTVRYAVPTAVAVAKGDPMPSGEFESETMAQFDYRNVAAGVQRTTFDDVANAGKDKIKDYVKTRLRDANDSLKQKYELALWGAFDDGTSSSRKKEIQSLNDMIPSFANMAAGTYGGIARSNTWWNPKYKAKSANPEINLLSDWKNLYNTTYNNQEAPNLIVTDQATNEIYEEFALDASQIIKSDGGQLADLGFDVLKFKGKDVVWTPNITAGEALFLNTNWIEVVYEPALWFQMTDWKSSPNQLERVAQILCRMTMLTTQPRRHGRWYLS